MSDGRTPPTARSAEADRSGNLCGVGATPEEIARRLGGGAAAWSLDRRVVVAESNQRREAEPLMIIGHATSKLCVIELKDEPGRWYCGADDEDRILTWTWFETVEEAWEWLD